MGLQPKYVPGAHGTINIDSGTPGVGVPSAGSGMTFAQVFGLLKPKRSDTPDGWAEKVTRGGGTYSAGTLTALRALDYDLSLFDIKRKMVYLNMRCGSDITAAKVPMIARNGPGFDVVLSGSFAAWTEANGLVNSSAGVMSTGVSCTSRGMGPGNFALGVYMLSDAPSTNAALLGAVITANAPQLIPGAFGNYILFDGMGVRTQTDSTLISDGNLTKGLICASQYGAASSAVFRNGVIRGTTRTVNTNTGAAPIALFGALGTSGGDFIAQGLTPDDVANLTWIMHAFNAALSRQVTAEGLS